MPQRRVLALLLALVVLLADQLSKAWLLHQPRVTAPIIGPRTLAQLDDALEALTIALDTSTLEALDGIFPGPGGEAPEAYAW